jgi:hypothetical protein
MLELWQKVRTREGKTMITIEELQNKFPVQNVPGHGRCIIIPGNDFDPDWESDLEETCEDDEVAGQQVTLVILDSKGDEEDGSGLGGSNLKPAPPEHIGPIGPTERKPIQPIDWTPSQDQLLINLWKQKISVPTIRVKFPERTENYIRYHIRKLLKKGLIESRWSTKRSPKQEKPEIRAPEKQVSTRKDLSSQRWSQAEDDLLVGLWPKKLKTHEIATHFPNRSQDAVKNRLGALQTLGRIEPRWKAGPGKRQKREKVEKKEQSTLTEIPTSIPTEAPTHPPIEPPVKEDSILTVLKKIRDLLCPRDFSFDYYCRSCGESGTTCNSERIWEFCPVCGKPFVISNVEEFSE